MKPPYVGADVLCILDDVTRPLAAKVTALCEDSSEQGCVFLTVFFPYDEAQPNGGPDVVRGTHIKYDPTRTKPESWHWPHDRN